MDPKFAVLGPVQVRDSAGRQVSVGGPRPRALTCALVAEAGRVVSVDRLIDRVWGDEPPPTAVGTPTTPNWRPASASTRRWKAGN